MLSTPARHRSVFQPILSLADGQVAGYEGLSRFDAEPLRSPDQWFAEATRAGLGAEFQAAAIERVLAAATAARLPDRSFVSVNVSPRYLAHPAVAAAVGPADPARLVIELTEEETVDDYATLRRVMNPYLELGIRFAVDDAGAGFASMRHITELGPAFVKLDAYLVRGLRTRHTLQAFLRAINGFAIEIGAVLIAEGVEQTTDLALLTQTGFPVLAQGYAIAHPGPPWPRVSVNARRAWLAAHSGRPLAESAASDRPGTGGAAPVVTGRPDA